MNRNEKQSEMCGMASGTHKIVRFQRKEGKKKIRIVEEGKNKHFTFAARTGSAFVVAAPGGLGGGTCRRGREISGGAGGDGGGQCIADS